MLTGGWVAAQEVIHRIEGTATLSQFGRAAEVGDLTGDGVPDLVMNEDRVAGIFF